MEREGAGGRSGCGGKGERGGTGECSLICQQEVRDRRRRGGLAGRIPLLGWIGFRRVGGGVLWKGGGAGQVVKLDMCIHSNGRVVWLHMGFAYVVGVWSQRSPRPRQSAIRKLFCDRFVFFVFFVRFQSTFSLRERELIRGSFSRRCFCANSSWLNLNWANLEGQFI